MQTDFERVDAYFRGVKWREWDTDYHAECPFCRKPVKRGQTHFSYSEKGFKCFVCGESGGLKRLIRDVMGERVQTDPRPPQNPPRRKKQPHSTAIDPNLLGVIGENERGYIYSNDFNTWDFWQSYKPLSMETVKVYQLSFGYMPYDLYKIKSGRATWDTCVPRLLMPIFRNHQLVMVRGRLLARDTDRHPNKWMTNGKPKRLFNVEHVREGDTVMIIENMADCLLLAEQTDFVGVASTGGASAWEPSWSQVIVSRNPRAVVIALDHDDAGELGAQKIADTFADFDLPVYVRRWEVGTPLKTGIDDILLK